MDIKEPTLNRMLKSDMKYRSQEQKVLAGNIANIDTPGFKAKALAPLDFNKMAQSAQLQMAATAPQHLPGTLGNGSPFRSKADGETFETRPTQNNVVLEDQMAKVSDAGAKYNLSSTLLKKYTGLYRAALGNR